MNFIWGLITGMVVTTAVCLIWRKMKKPPEASEKVVYQNKDEAEKQENLKKIEDYIIGQDKFTNNELQNMLGVSDTTIGRYLEELESAGKIKQVGATGKFVYYTKE